MSQRIVHIEKKGHDAHASAVQLRKAMRKAAMRDLNAAEAAALTGLPVERCEEALFHLAKAFPAQVRVTESGALYFTFATLEKQARPQGLAKVWAFFEEHGPVLMAIATFTLGPVVLLGLAGNAMGILDAGYREAPVPPPATAAAFLIIVLSLTLALSLVMYNPAIGAVIVLLWSWWRGLEATAAIQTLVFVGVFGLLASRAIERALKHYAGGELGNWLQTARAWASGYLFGPRSHDRLADERRLTAAILEHDQVLSVRDLMLLFGWDKAEAEAQMPRLLVDYGGELIVTEDGAMVLKFDHQAVDANYLDLHVDLRPAYEREGAPKLWGCPTWLGVGLSATMAFLVWGLAVHPQLVLFPGPGTWARLAAEDPNLPSFQVFGALPYVLAFAPTLIRLPGWLSERRAYAGDRNFHTLMHLLKISPEGGPVKGLDHAALVRFGGDIDMARSGEGGDWVTFPLLAAGDRAAAAMRQGDRRPDPVVYETGS